MGYTPASPVPGVAAVKARSFDDVAIPNTLEISTIAPYFPSSSFVSPLFVAQSQHLALAASVKALPIARHTPTSNIGSFCGLYWQQLSVSSIR